MADTQVLIDVLERRVERRNERRDFFKSALGAVAVAGASGLFYADPALAQSAPSDTDVLNFALNLEYLEANYYSYAAFGTPIAATLTTSGSGAAGVPATGGHIVPFQDTAVANYAKEIAQDEIAHVTFLRQALGNTAVAQPQLDVGVSATGAFTTLAKAAGIPLNAGAAFDPYLDDNSFLLGAFVFEDVGVTAYKGASPLVANKTYLEAAAGILAVEAYHAAIVRTTLYAKGMATPNLRTYADGISNARDSVDGASDDDQGISPVTVNGLQASNIVPLDNDGLAYSRSTGQVLNVVYLTNKAVTMGGFFPAGVNGNIKQSAAN